MNWLEKHRKKIEDMKMSETIVKVPKAESKILKSKFCGNKDVKEIYLPQTVLYIDKSAFRDCISLEKINLPPNVCYIHEETFKGCIALKEIVAQNPVPPKCVVGLNSSLFDDVLDVVCIPTISSNFGKKDGNFFEGFVIISQKFHNERAIYLAEHLPLEAHNITGFNAADATSNMAIMTYVREYFARVKVFMDIFTQKKPMSCELDEANKW